MIERPAGCDLVKAVLLAVAWRASVSRYIMKKGLDVAMTVIRKRTVRLRIEKSVKWDGKHENMHYTNPFKCTAAVQATAHPAGSMDTSSSHLKHSQAEEPQSAAIVVFEEKVWLGAWAMRYMTQTLETAGFLFANSISIRNRRCPPDHHAASRIPWTEARTLYQLCLRFHQDAYQPLLSIQSFICRLYIERRLK